MCRTRTCTVPRSSHTTATTPAIGSSLPPLSATAAPLDHLPHALAAHMADSGDDASLLVVVLDVSSAGWRRVAALPGLGEAGYVRQALAFANAYAALNHDNRLVVLAAGTATSHVLHLSANCGLQPAPRGAGGDLLTPR